MLFSATGPYTVDVLSSPELSLMYFPTVINNQNTSQTNMSAGTNLQYANLGLGDSGSQVSGASFLGKLLAMVEDTQCQQHICWAPNGKTFIVFEPVSFARDILPKYFKHSNFSSFVRQLNMYDFHKVANVQQVPGVPHHEWEFQNEFFIRGRSDLLANVRRKAHTVTANEQPMTGGKSDSLKRVFSQIEEISDRNKHIKCKIDTMESDNKIMWNEMARLKTKHTLQQQTINRVLYFLTSVYAPDRISGTDNPALAQAYTQAIKADGSTTPVSMMPPGISVTNTGVLSDGFGFSLAHDNGLTNVSIEPINSLMQSQMSLPTYGTGHLLPNGLQTLRDTSASNSPNMGPSNNGLY